ncbi:maltose permease [Pochonia chlamydosporia 170]|uniref:Maltose permease n=1 Tax=Pochonia chlamydosporia 170 TaxID=1380566 RepID=A0A179FC74_METCM|nr:maltose permease [Pochonia chlamydosporia 170]OAQ62967.1 maltose permease [Pochonia chlamydosporia 170]
MATKEEDNNLEARVSGVEEVNFKHETVRIDHQLEHELTVKDVFKKHPAVVWWSFFWSMAGVGWGFDAQVNGGMLGVASFRRDFGYIYQGEAVLPADWQTAFNTVSSVGQFFGGFLCSWMADKIGRKWSLLFGIAIVTGGIFGEMFSTARAAFVVSKLILGLGLGFYLTLAPLATSESAPVVFRGISTAGVQFGIGSGQLLSNAVIKGFGEWDSRWAYRAPFAIQLFFCAFLLVFLPFAPETPWYLARVGKREEARKSLRKLYGRDVDIDAKLITLEATIAEEEAAKSDQGSIIQCLRGTDRIRTGISTGIFACQHFVGIIFVLGYSSYFFQLAGLPVDKSFDLGVGVTACGLLGIICSWFIMNSYGRRNIFIGGMVAMTSILLLIGILDFVHTDGAKWAQAALTVIYAFFYFASLGAMAFAILGEASSTSLRAPTIALATATQAVMGIIFNFAIPYMINPDEGNLRGKVGFIFGGLAAIATVWSFFYVPELKGRTFDEIDRMFQAKVPPRKMGSYVLDSY